MAETILFLGALIKILFMTLGSLVLCCCIAIVIFFLTVVIKEAFKPLIHKDDKDGEKED